MENSRFDSALTTFATLSNEKHKDSDKKLDEARTGQEKSKQEDLEKKYQYVINHKTNNDETTVEYMKDLVIADYKDSNLIQDEMDVWKFSCYVNNSSEGSSSMSYISKQDTVYVHFKSISGSIGEQKNIRVVVYMTNEFFGETDENVFYEEESTAYSCSDNYIGCRYNTPSAVTESSPCRAVIIDSDTGKTIDTLYFNY